MQDQPSTHGTSPAVAVKHFLWGAIPALLGGIVLIVHLFEPLVGHDHQGILLILVAISVLISLAIWGWYVLQGIATVIAELVRTVNHLCASTKHLHKKLDAQAVKLAEYQKEADHLRELALGADVHPLNGQRLGPRALT